MAIFNDIAAGSGNQTAGNGLFSQIAGDQNSAPQSFGQKLMSAIKGGLGLEKDIATGVAKGGTSTLLGIAGIGNKIQQTISSGLGKVGVNVAPSAAGKESVFNSSSPTGQKAQQIVAASNTGEAVGKTGEQIAEYFIPSGLATKGEKVVDLISRGITSPVLAAGARIVGKGVVQGTAAGTVKLAQTGGDIKAARETALTAGVARGTIATLGEAARGFNLPERLYSTIFKNSKADMLSELNSNGLAALQKNNPDAYKKFVSEGLIRTTEGGRPVLDQTLAEEALNKGLKGSIRGMANEVVSKTLESESNARAIASGYSGTVKFPEKQFISVLDDVAAQYKDVGFGELADEANRLAGNLEISAGELSGEDALALRRLLDKLRIATSFNPSAATKLSLTQQNFKTLSDAARQRVNAIPGMGDVMKNYSFYIDAMDALAKEAARRGNNQIIGLIDTLFLGSSLSGGENALPLATTGLARRLLLSGPGTTAAGSLLNKSAASPLMGGTIGAGSSGAQSLLANPQ